MLAFPAGEAEPHRLQDRPRSHGCLTSGGKKSLREIRSMGFQDPKMEVLYHFSGHILGVYPLT
jgi:hypothetical protein